MRQSSQGRVHLTRTLISEVSVQHSLQFLILVPSPRSFLNIYNKHVFLKTVSKKVSLHQVVISHLNMFYNSMYLTVLSDTPHFTP